MQPLIHIQSLKYPSYSYFTTRLIVLYKVDVNVAYSLQIVMSLNESECIVKCQYCWLAYIQNFMSVYE